MTNNRKDNNERFAQKINRMLICPLSWKSLHKKPNSVMTALNTMHVEEYSFKLKFPAQEVNRKAYIKG